MAIPLLDAAEEAELQSLGGKSWLSSNSKWARTTRQRLIESVDRLVEFQEDIRAPSPQDPLALTKLMAIVLRYDAAFLGYFAKRNPANPDWNRFCELAAGGIVQRWTAERDLSAESIQMSGAWDVDPDYLNSLEALIELAKDEGVRASQDVHPEMPKNEWASGLKEDHDFVAQAEASLREYLESHEDLAQPADDGEIPISTQNREIEKAALLDLRMRDLKEVAEEKGIPLSKSKDRLVESIVDQGNLNREQIAKLVLQYYPDDPFERGITTHLVPLREAPVLDDVVSRLNRLAGKYARIRVARWFLFDEAARPTPQRLVIKGVLRGYRTKAVIDTDDYKINATPQRTDVRVRLLDGSSWAEVDARNVADVKDLRVVLNRGAEIPTRLVISPQLETMQGPAAGWDPRSVWFLDFLNRELEDVAIEIFNFEMAHFERVAATIEEVGQPQIDKVELRGQHVGAHRDSCSLITSGRRLLEIIVRIRYMPNGSDEFLIPVRISFFPDRATVATAPSKDAPASVMGDLHRSLVAKVRSALDHEVRFSDVSQVANKITQRAEQASPAKEADLFAPKSANEQEIQQEHPPGSATAN
jgi:hypothetical protein